MSGMEPLGIGLALGGSALSAGGSIMQGRESSRAAHFEQMQLQQQAQQLRTAANQSEAQRREETTSAIETIAALRAGRGVGAGSPSAMAIYDKVIQDSSRDIAIERTNYMTRAELSDRAALMSERKRRTSLLAGDLTAGATLLNTGANLYGAKRA
jgi:hypothetical protein